MPVWPAALPQSPLLQGYSEQDQDNAIRFQPEVGPPKVRRRGTAAAKELSISLTLTTSQRDVFVAFYRTDLADGTSTFTWKDPGEGYGTFQFVGPPQLSKLAPNAWRASFQLLRLH